MELELSLEKTYDDIFNDSFGLSQSYLANVYKAHHKVLIHLMFFVFYDREQDQI